MNKSQKKIVPTNFKKKSEKSRTNFHKNNKFHLSEKILKIADSNWAIKNGWILLFKNVSAKSPKKKYTTIEKTVVKPNLPVKLGDWIW